MKHPEIVGKMSLEEKAKFVTGDDYWHAPCDEQLGLPRIMLTDGPHGLRKKNPEGKGIGLGDSVPATCMPPASMSACSWDEELLKKEGEALAEECLAEKVSVILGPGTNIKRSPVCGRNFEYFSEDPFLAGKMSANLINGCQSKGVGTSLKHFACNSQEAYRMIVNEVIDERTMREIYFPAFEIAVKEAQPWTIMNSYNRINGVYASQNDWLQNKVAREEWGFEGLFVTDWGASVDRVPGLKAGTDLEMPSSLELNVPKIVNAVKNGTLDEKVLNERVDKVVDLIIKSKPALEKDYTYNVEEHHQLAARVAEGSMVLLKNEDNVLPLKAGKKVAVIGEMAKAPRYQGPGSSVIKPTKISNAYDELKALDVDVVYAQGYYKAEPKKDRIPDSQLLAEAVNAAKMAEVAVIFAGLPEGLEAEGYDRLNIDMPETHNKLISEVAKVQPNTVVVLAGGSVVLMPWANEVKAILNSGLGGQATGIAVANILTGKVNPSGKTAETYPLAYEDNPVYGNYPGEPVVSEHKESVYIGYRYYDTAEKEVLFPFGHGLSYTTFEYSDIKVSSEKIKDTDTVEVTFKIKNTGDVDGAEVAEIYVADLESTIFRPKKELRAFKKVFLKAGEEQTVSVTLDKRAFAYYNVNINDWHVETGEFDIIVGASSRDVRLTKTITVTSTVDAEVPNFKETAPAYYTADLKAIDDAQWTAVYGKELPSRERDLTKKIDIYCCLEDARHTKWGAKICKLVTGVSAGGGANVGDGAMLQAMALQIPIRNFIAMSAGAFDEKMAQGLIEVLNDDTKTSAGFGKILAGIPRAIKKIPYLIKSI